MFGGGVENEVSSVLQFLQFMSIRLCQFTLEGWDVELDNKIARKCHL